MDATPKMNFRDRLARGLGIPVRIPMDGRRGHDLRARIDGRVLHVRSERTEFVLTPEALGSAFLLPAMAVGRRLSGTAIDPVWRANSLRIQDQARAWWGWQTGALRFNPGPSGRPGDGVGLAFSLGVDSFYSCFFAEPSPDLLILAGGFDIPLARRDVLSAMCDSVAEVARATGRDWTMIETDLRAHRLFRKLPWDFSHGGAVAFLGHVLQDRIGTLLISSSYDNDHLGPYGSHPDLDPLWSSSRLNVLHIGHEVTRLGKLRRLVNHPQARSLIQRHLRVCWENPSTGGNCGYCHKCVMTRIGLHREAPGFHLDTMPEDVPLVEAIEALPPLMHELSLNFRREMLGGQDVRVDAALRDLIGRSEEAMAQ